MKDIIKSELATVREELQSEDPETDFAGLLGWEKALLWVLRQLPEEG